MAQGQQCIRLEGFQEALGRLAVRSFGQRDMEEQRRRAGSRILKPEEAWVGERRGRDVRRWVNLLLAVVEDSRGMRSLYRTPRSGRVMPRFIAVD